MNDETLFTQESDILRTWHQAGMPKWEQKDLNAIQKINVHMPGGILDRIKLFELMRIEHGINMRWTWFPEQDWNDWTDSDSPPTVVEPNKYPIYVISKGRWESRLTVKQLEHLGIPHKMVIEPQEYDRYAAVSNPKNILQLPFSNLGEGSIPARNWVLDRAKKEGHAKHWILDDNIQGFYEMNHNRKPMIKDFNPFRVMEFFVDQFSNVGLAGPNYEFMTQRRSPMNPYKLNTRVYSCILLDHSLPFRWRGKYNEDTDLSLRVLKSGLCTILFNFIQAKKVPTMSMKGGNTDDLYLMNEEFDRRLEMAKSLKMQHPELVKITRKWDRWQHHVDYSPFQLRRMIRREKLKGKGENAPKLVLRMTPDNSKKKKK